MVFWKLIDYNWFDGENIVVCYPKLSLVPYYDHPMIFRVLCTPLESYVAGTGMWSCFYWEERNFRISMMAYLKNLLDKISKAAPPELRSIPNMLAEEALSLLRVLINKEYVKLSEFDLVILKVME